MIMQCVIFREKLHRHHFGEIFYVMVIFYFRDTRRPRRFHNDYSNILAFFSQLLIIARCVIFFFDLPHVE